MDTAAWVTLLGLVLAAAGVGGALKEEGLESAENLQRQEGQSLTARLAGVLVQLGVLQAGGHLLLGLRVRREDADWTGAGVSRTAAGCVVRPRPRGASASVGLRDAPSQTLGAAGKPLQLVRNESLQSRRPVLG
ncbi:pro-FMRFamide-related neuropeptide FF like isoform X1 [Lepisosteus oculatus]|uniref:pro-FMRFamide-related neuropeptide FF like isoform X1 n=1 Tax=Lepisosteus oculatus TaxID=7918 RepID=UPI00073FAF2D|nr:PREDICTED: pro-FMRFamide-related neuropeptide FF isoform X1 [Lepisosteus oculatus]XP_015199728.1 PREDICTED: pro-FMRFamide-related neuropeptide FF isoform X1 [Lepisosteus oculatus]XP_015199729.1 PREDICTED: pro-FMRFamide-related neuropeptide FF isoform X1 [Lepisosteus oculatus]